MERSFDIAIIGSGLAAFAAAVELKGSGKEVVIITKSPGGTALNSGAWDLADSPLRTLSIHENLSEMIRRQEGHPYAVFSRGFIQEDFFSFFKKQIERAVEALPLRMAGGVENNLQVVTPFGTVKPTAWVQESMIDADLGRMDQAKVLVVGISGFPNFNARFICQSLLDQQEKEENSSIQFTGQFEVEMPFLKSHSSLNAVELASLLDHEKHFVKFGHTVVQYIQRKIYTHLLLPPILGLKNTAAIVEALRKITGLKVAETLAVPMSVPGWRLQEAIQQYFENQGISILEGEGVNAETVGRKVRSVRVHREDRLVRVKAKSFLLATGKYIGGGIQRRQRFQEPIFNLPLYFQDKKIDDQSVLRTSELSAINRQPFLSAGVRINPLGQALDENQQVAYDNLFAAGGVLADFDPSHERCAAGVSLLSGTIAARHAVQVV